MIWLSCSRCDVVSPSLFAMFFGLDLVAMVPPTVRRTALHFGAVKAPIGFGWNFAADQMGGAVLAWRSGATRNAWPTYMPAHFVIGGRAVWRRRPFSPSTAAASER